MHFQVSDILDGVSQFSFRTAKLRSDCLNTIGPACQSALDRGIGGIIFDLSQVGAIPNGALAALIEAVGRFRQLEFAFVGISGGALRRLARTGLDRHIRHFASSRAALDHPNFRRFALCKTHAVLSLRPQPSGIAGLFGTKSLAEIDILGHPLLVHQLHNLAAFGIKTAFLDVPHSQIPAIKSILVRQEQAVQCLICTQPEASDGPNLKEIPHDNFGPQLRENLITSHKYLRLAPDALWRGRLDKILFAHLANNRQDTCITTKTGTLLARLCQGQSLLETSTRARAPHPEHCTPITTPIGWVKQPDDVLCLLRLASKRAICELAPNGVEIEPNIWRATGANISPRAQVRGFCYAGPSSAIEANARLYDFNVLGQHARAEGNSRSESCLILPETTLKPSTSLKHRIVGPSAEANPDARAKQHPEPVTPRSFARTHALGSAA
jgi:hypothetical protein